ncbi:MAG: hypothetical protein OEV92_08435, partial [Nitrospinota bacterium]|nr:hypothetical protein [Nitrospinota bacterium]
GDLWMEIYKDSAVASVIEEAPAKALEIILGKGSLATRILRATGQNPTREDLIRVYGALGGSLAAGVAFLPA